MSPIANALYDLGRQGFLDGSIDWDTNKVKAVLVHTSGGYTVNLATDQFLSSISGGDRVATSGTMTSMTVTAGVADAADVTFTAVSGSAVGAIVIYRAAATTGASDDADTAQRLIAYIDTATGLPVTPNGGDITVAFDNGANKIFKL